MNDIYDTYIADKNNLGLKSYFKGKNPAAIQEMTAVMLETARKGMWKASPEQISTLADLHTEVVNEFGAACSGFVCDNPKLREYIASKTDAASAKAYNRAVAEVRAENIASEEEGVVMKRDELNTTETTTNRVSGIIVGVLVAVALAGLLMLIRRRRKNSAE